MIHRPILCRLTIEQFSAWRHSASELHSVLVQCGIFQVTFHIHGSLRSIYHQEDFAVTWAVMMSVISDRSRRGSTMTATGRENVVLPINVTFCNTQICHGPDLTLFTYNRDTSLKKLICYDMSG